MEARTYKYFEEANPAVAFSWIRRLFCKHEYVAFRLDKTLFEEESKYLFFTCRKCGQQYICKTWFK